MPTLDLDKKKLGKRFCVVMDATGWDVPTTAEVLGVGEAQVYRYRSGETALSPARATRMADGSVKTDDLRGADADAVRSYLLGANLGLLFGGVGSSDDGSAMGGSTAASPLLRSDRAA